MSVPTILENRLSSLRDSVIQKAKGGENEMESEWEKLEKLSKDELIIELVRSRWQMRNLQKVIEDLSKNLGGYCLYEPGQKPSKDWVKKIAEYAFRNGPENLCEWGVDEDTADAMFDERFDADDAFDKED